MSESKPIRWFLLAGATPLALILVCLGLETVSTNILGGFLILMGTGYITGGAIYLWVKKKPTSAAREETGDRSFWLVLPGFLAVFFAPPLEYLYLPVLLPRGSGAQIAGLALIGLGLLLRIWTRMALREMYSGHVQVLAGHRLVQSGPYRWVRHPGYAGFILMALGVAIGYSSIVGLAATLALLLPGLVYRMKVEESLIAEQFGDQYRQYAQGTKRLIPGVW